MAMVRPLQGRKCVLASGVRRFTPTATHGVPLRGRALTEVYSTLTRLPGRHRLSGEQVLLFLENIRERLTLVTLDPEEYFAAVQEAAAAGIVGGAICDALLAQSALKTRAETLYTWNVKHFQRINLEIARRVKTP